MTKAKRSKEPLRKVFVLFVDNRPSAVADNEKVFLPLGDGELVYRYDFHKK